MGEEVPWSEDANKERAGYTTFSNAEPLDTSVAIFNPAGAQ